MTQLLARPTPVPRASRRRVRVGVAAAGLGVAAASLLGIGAGNPSYWGDEAASVLSAERSWSSLLLELRHIDAVHGVYYAFLHLWIGVAGTSEAMVRLPSVLAAGFAVAGIVLLGERLFGFRVGVIAGVVLAVTPEFARQAIEARSYAIDIAAAVWLTLLLVRILARPSRSARSRRMLWGAYALLLAASVTTFEFLVFLVPVHAVLVYGRSVPRELRRGWWAAAAIGSVLSLPLVVIAWTERQQIRFLAHHDYATAQHVLVSQWFASPVAAGLWWAAILVGAIAIVAAPVRRRAGAAVLTWLALPTVALLAVNALAIPVYNMRYLSISLGAVALVAAVGLDAAARRMPWRLPRILALGAAVALLTGSALPALVAQRGPYAKGGGSDLRQASHLLASLAAPGDAVVFDQTVRTSEHPAVAVRLYPADFARLDDVALDVPLDRLPGIWDRYLPVDRLGSRLDAHPVVWADEIRGTASTDVNALESLGYRITATYPVHRTVLYRMERTAP